MAKFVNKSLSLLNRCFIVPVCDISVDTTGFDPLSVNVGVSPRVGRWRDRAFVIKGKGSRQRLAVLDKEPEV